MKLFTVKLTDEEREALEAHRVRLGLRSHAETVRALIASPNAAPPAPAYTAYGEADLTALKLGLFFDGALPARDMTGIDNPGDATPSNRDSAQAELRSRGGDAIAYGPVKAEPGSRLKRPMQKGSKK